MILSVIIPGFDTRRAWWVRCVASVARAVAEAVGDAGEIVCVDDGSETPVERAWFGDACGVDVRVVRLARNAGLPTARNRGLDVVRGEFVTFVDSDDEVTPGCYAKCLAALETHGADVAAFGVKGVYANDGMCCTDVPADKFYGALTPRDVAFLVKSRLFYYSWNKVFRRTFLEAHGFRFHPEGVPCEDAIFNVGLVRAGAKWVTVADAGYVYYRYDGSLLSTYKPTYVQGTRACTAAWRAYKAETPGAREQMDEYGLGWYDETSDADVVRGQWTNIWRRRSPHGLAAKWRFAADHKAELGRCTPWVFFKKAVFTWARAHLYVKPIRKWHCRRFCERIGAKMVPWEG